MSATWKWNAGLFSKNCVLNVPGFYVSYNPGPMAADDGQAETALVKDSDYYILNGDFRAEYEALVPQGFDACLAFFREKEFEHGSSWTSTNVRTPVAEA